MDFNVIFGNDVQSIINDILADRSVATWIRKYSGDLPELLDLYMDTKLIKRNQLMLFIDAGLDINREYELTCDMAPCTFAAMCCEYRWYEQLEVFLQNGYISPTESNVTFHNNLLMIIIYGHSHSDMIKYEEIERGLKLLEIYKYSPKILLKDEYEEAAKYSIFKSEYIAKYMEDVILIDKYIDHTVDVEELFGDIKNAAT